MSDCAAHLVDEVLPEAPMRQWVCSLPWQLRYAMGYDAKLCSAVLAEFMPALRRSLRHRAKLLAANAKVRAQVVPGPVVEPAEPTQMGLLFDGEATELELGANRRPRHPWAWLLQRVFAVDIMTCRRYQAAMKLKTIATKPEDIARALAQTGLGPRPPPRPRPTPPGQRTLSFAA